MTLSEISLETFNMKYAWLNDSLLSLKLYHYFDMISNTEREGSLLISLTKRKRIIINILRTSKRCIRVCFTYIQPAVPVMLQEFHSFQTIGQLLHWLKFEVLERYFSNVPPKRLDINKFYK